MHCYWQSCSRKWCGTGMWCSWQRKVPLDQRLAVKSSQSARWHNAKPHWRRHACVSWRFYRRYITGITTTSVCEVIDLWNVCGSQIPQNTFHQVNRLSNPNHFYQLIHWVTHCDVSSAVGDHVFRMDQKDRMSRTCNGSFSRRVC